MNSELTVFLDLDTRKTLRKLRVIQEATNYLIDELEAIDDGCPDCGSVLLKDNVCIECGEK